MVQLTSLSTTTTRPAAPTLRFPRFGALLLAALVSACEPHSGKETAAEQAPAQPALVTQVTYQGMTQPHTFAATIRPRIESDLGFRVSGKVAQRLVQNGDLVHKG